MAVINAPVEWHEVFVITDGNNQSVVNDRESYRSVGFEEYQDAVGIAMELGVQFFAIAKFYVTAREWHLKFITYDEYESKRNPAHGVGTYQDNPDKAAKQAEAIVKGSKNPYTSINVS